MNDFIYVSGCLSQPIPYGINQTHFKLHCLFTVSTVSTVCNFSSANMLTQKQTKQMNAEEYWREKDREREAQREESADVLG